MVSERRAGSFRPRRERIMANPALDQKFAIVRTAEAKLDSNVVARPLAEPLPEPFGLAELGSGIQTDNLTYIKI
jgi:hypothetical protein